MYFCYFLDSHFRGNDTPSPALLRSGAGLSTARGEAGCFIRLKCYDEAMGRGLATPTGKRDHLHAAGSGSRFRLG